MTEKTATTEILSLIENVDPSDGAMLDQIDARVWCWLNNHAFAAVRHHKVYRLDGETQCELPAELFGNIPKYCTSRDALKAIRPEGWTINIDTGPDAKCLIFHPLFGLDRQEVHFKAWDLPTEELAELSAILQATAHERGES